MSIKFSSETRVLTASSILNKCDTTVTKLKNNTYKTYSFDELRDCVVGWIIEDTNLDMKSYCKHRKIPRTTLSSYMKNFPSLKEMRDSSTCNLQQAEAMFDHCIKGKENRLTLQLNKVHETLRYMSDDEEGVLANIAILMANCGRGICREEVLELLNLSLAEKTDKRLFIPATMKVVTGVMKRNPKLQSTVRSAASLDSARAAQANEETRDSMFTKLDNYVALMHEMGICTETSYCEFKNTQIYNMDECAIDTTRRQKKVLCSKEDVKRLFQITPEGDNKMNVHISLALTSRADGKFIYH